LGGTRADGGAVGVGVVGAGIVGAWPVGAGVVVDAGALAGVGVGVARVTGAVDGAGAGVGVGLLAKAGATVSVVCPAGAAAVSSLAGAPPQETTSDARARTNIPARYAGAFLIVRPLDIVGAA
jgi:hypothetical protein